MKIRDLTHCVLKMLNMVQHLCILMYILASDLLFQTALLKYNFAFFSGKVPVCSPN